ncbi:hypothetical protein BLNAU_11088 [Blattamonas nauphoetae]|uniref:Uncharacterized protein n=1 Tax=Blattamonas nauphoetae TaxID=2049346 RepID=A0ABQ9XPK8_9EUKA|nr:hypothetical protein BLNAU_11088 [Blattamonas nauphoetae]
MDLISCLFYDLSPIHRLTLIKADLIPQLIVTLNPLFRSFAEAVDIHTRLLSSITSCFWLSTPDSLTLLEHEYGSGRQNVHETVLTQVLAPSEEYISHLCENRYSIVDGQQSKSFLYLLAQLLEISPSYQPMTDFVLHMPVFLTIPSCLTFFEDDDPIHFFLSSMVNIQHKWNKTKGEVRQLGKTVQRMLRMEGMEDVIEAKLRNEQNGYDGRWIVAQSIRWNNQHGMDLPKPW